MKFEFWVQHDSSGLFQFHCLISREYLTILSAHVHAPEPRTDLDHTSSPVDRLENGSPNGTGIPPHHCPLLAQRVDFKSIPVEICAR